MHHHPYCCTRRAPQAPSSGMSLCTPDATSHVPHRTFPPPLELALRYGAFPKDRRRARRLRQTPNRLHRREPTNSQSKDEKRNVERLGGPGLGASAEVQHRWIDEAERDTVDQLTRTYCSDASARKQLFAACCFTIILCSAQRERREYEYGHDGVRKRTTRNYQ